MAIFNPKIFNNVLQFSIVGFTFALAYFAFVYYPKVVNTYKTGNVPAQSILKPVSANSVKFPIETSAYMLAYEEGSQTYYAFIQGSMLDVFEFNRQNAKLALKTALSAEDLCDFNIIYVSAAELEVPQNLTDNSDC